MVPFVEDEKTIFF